MQNLKHLFLKELTLELRRKSVISGLLLYLFSTAWITILFTVINTVAKSFIGEKRGRDIYYYSIASPEAIIISKVIYNFLLTILLSFTGFFLFVVLLNNPVLDVGLFSLVIVLGAMGFSASLTLLSGIAAKANNSHILMSVLSFPIIISVLLITIKVTKNCIDGLDRSVSTNDLLTLLAINCLVTAASYLLFPYIWRS